MSLSTVQRELTEKGNCSSNLLQHAADCGRCATVREALPQRGGCGGQREEGVLARCQHHQAHAAGLRAQVTAQDPQIKAPAGTSSCDTTTTNHTCLPLHTCQLLQ